MSTTQSLGTCIAFRTQNPEQFLRTASRSLHAGNRNISDSLDSEDLMMLNRFGEQFTLNGIDISYEELLELKVFDEFLAFHVQPDRTGDVQCRRVWNEWVRTYRHRVHEFPKLILEKELQNVISDKFSVAVVENDFWGLVYCGLRFVP